MPFDPSLDPGIEEAVMILAGRQVETFESCEGGPGHAFPVPTVRFHGGVGAGFMAYAIAIEHGLRVAELRQVWAHQDGALTGPNWELTFRGRGPSLRSETAG